MGGRFDGVIIGERRAGSERTVSRVSSGDNPGRTILSNVQDAFARELDQEPLATADVTTDQNIELVASLSEELRAGDEERLPGSVVLPPGSVDDRLRWLGTWPELGPIDTVRWLGLSVDAPWQAIAAAVFQRFQECWAAGVAYHH